MLHRFDCPADGLVISDEGDRAIALSIRGQSTQLTQLDLPGRQSRSWGLVPITGGAKTYEQYKALLANCDLTRRNDLDERGTPTRAA
jgi:hypothetical protein